MPPAAADVYHDRSTLFIPAGSPEADHERSLLADWEDDHRRTSLRRVSACAWSRQAEP
jgi:hypothetical protein